MCTFHTPSTQYCVNSTQFCIITTQLCVVCDWGWEHVKSPVSFESPSQEDMTVLFGY
jgi:hypothetical protein